MTPKCLWKYLTSQLTFVNQGFRNSHQNKGFPWWLRGVKNSPANARDADLIHGLGRYPGGGHGNPLQHSCLENPMDGRAWQATIHGVEKNQTQLSISK